MAASTTAPTVVTPELTQGGFYEPLQLIDFFDKAASAGMSNYGMSVALSVPVDRVVYFRGDEGQAQLRKRSRMYNKSRP